MSYNSIVLCSDLVPGLTLEKYFCNSIEDIFDVNLINLLRDNYSIFNLECPICDCNLPILKCGPNLKCSKDCINGLLQLYPNLMLLANNHIMDYGIDGLKSTLNILSERKIDYIGAGNNLSEARKTKSVIISGKKIGIFNVAEHEFSIASSSLPGANPFDYINNYSDLLTLKNNNDFVIVIYHGGKEYFKYPMPELRRRLQWFVDLGADLVVCQHTHCVGCQEIYKGKNIIYGQGNFSFIGSKQKKEQDNLLLKIDVVNSKLKVSYVPISFMDNSFSINYNSSVVAEFFDRSSKLDEEGFLDNVYYNYIKSFSFSIFRRFDLFSNTFLFRLLNKLSLGYLEKVYFNKIYLKYMGARLLNVLECESWNEVARDSIKYYIKK